MDYQKAKESTRRITPLRYSQAVSGNQLALMLLRTHHETTRSCHCSIGIGRFSGNINDKAAAQATNAAEIQRQASRPYAW